MKKIFICFVFLFSITSCNAGKLNENNLQADSIRYPVFADKFYSADPKTLTNVVKTFLDDAKPQMVDSITSIIVPHAGYIYSGQIAADAFNQVKNNQYDVIAVIGTNHTTAGFTGVSIYPNGAFASPIGNVKVDNQIANSLLDEDNDFNSNLTVHAKEHSIEVQIPFIKYLFPDVKIVPAIIGEPDIELCTKFGKALAKVLKNKNALIVASSDLSHYPNIDDAIKTDNKTLQTIVGLNISEIHSELQKQINRNNSNLVTCACGEAPILATIAAAKELGANNGSIISYTNSGYNPIGGTDRVVGYGAVVISKGKKLPLTDVDSVITDNSYKLTTSDKQTLLKHARKTLEQYFSTQTVPLLRDMNPKLKLKRGAFVTLRKHGELRGCIGHMSEDTPLCTTVGAMALQAAFNDPRFNQLTHTELSQIEIEISVLTPFILVESADDIALGRDGVVIKKGNKQAVYLPQVATETGWGKEEFLNQLCYKAGLQSGDWKDSQLFTFQADVFSESDIH